MLQLSKEKYLLPAIDDKKENSGLITLVNNNNNKSPPPLMIVISDLLADGLIQIQVLGICIKFRLLH